MEKEKENRHFTSAPPSVNSTTIDQWEINALTAAVSVDKMFSGANPPKKKNLPRPRQTEANEDT